MFLHLLIHLKSCQWNFRIFGWMQTLCPIRSNHLIVVSGKKKFKNFLLSFLSLKLFLPLRVAPQLHRNNLDLMHFHDWWMQSDPWLKQSTGSIERRLHLHSKVTSNAMHFANLSNLLPLIPNSSTNSEKMILVENSFFLLLFFCWSPFHEGNFTFSIKFSWFLWNLLNYFELFCQFWGNFCVFFVKF